MQKTGTNFREGIVLIVEILIREIMELATPDDEANEEDASESESE